MENNSYSVQTNAGKSFRTFLLTLSISLILFSAVYYFLTTNASKPESLETSFNESKAVVNKVVDNSDVKESGEVAGAVVEKTVFGEIATKDTGGQVRQVLAAATDAPQTTTTAPNTGTTSVTIGLFSAFIFFIASLFVVSNNPRRLALNTFEKNITKSVDEE
jgi:hypothetical protein